MRSFLSLLAIAAVALGVLSGCSGNTDKSADTTANAEKRLSQLEDREAIRQLLIDYGHTLDTRDFAGFAALFADDAVYVGGGPTGESHGPAEIRAALEKTFAANPSGVSGPNMHLFFNETIDLDGDKATGVSKGVFTVQNAEQKPDMLIFATYHDMFVRVNGHWKFERREVHGDIPAPRKPASD